jgi:hypothetical protein
MSRKVSGPEKGTLVYIRHRYGREAGQVDDKNLFRIRKIGPKEATVVRVDITNPSIENTYGRVYRLHTKEEYEAANNQSYRFFYPYMWSQLFVGLGEVGWDASTNF